MSTPLYPGPAPTVRRAHVKSSPHELVLHYGPKLSTLQVACTCRPRLRVDVPVAGTDDELWETWLTELRHDTTRGRPERARPNVTIKLREAS